jgi:hypothetical protein
MTKSHHVEKWTHLVWTTSHTHAEWACFDCVINLLYKKKQNPKTCCSSVQQGKQVHRTHSELGRVLTSTSWLPTIVASTEFNVGSRLLVAQYGSILVVPVVTVPGSTRSSRLDVVALLVANISKSVFVPSSLP